MTRRIKQINSRSRPILVIEKNRELNGRYGTGRGRMLIVPLIRFDKALAQDLD